MPRTRLGKWLAQGAAQTTASPQQATLSRPKSTVPSLRKHKSKKAAPRGRAVALARAAQQVQQAPQVQPAQPAPQASGAVTTATLRPTAAQSPLKQAVTTNLNTCSLDRQQTLGLSAGLVDLLLPLRSLWLVVLLLRLQGQGKSRQLWELFVPVLGQVHSTDHNGPLFLEAAAAYVQMLSHSVLSAPTDTVKAATASTGLNAGSTGMDSASASPANTASRASVQAESLDNDNCVAKGATHATAYSDGGCAALLSSPARNIQWEKQLMHYVQLAVGHDQQSFRACALLAILATLTAQPHAAYYRHKALELYQRQDLSAEGLFSYLHQSRLKNGGRSEILLNRWFLQELNALAVQQWGVELVSLPLEPSSASVSTSTSTSTNASSSTSARPLSKGYNACNSARPHHHARSSAAHSPVEITLQLSALYLQQWQALGKGLRQELGSSNIPVTSQQLCAVISSSYELLACLVRALEDYAGQKVLANAVSSASNEHSTVAVKAVLEETDASAKQVTPIDNSGHTYSIDSAYDLSLSITAAQHESLPESSKHPEITALPVKPHLAMLGEQVCLDEQGTASSALNATSATGATSKAHVADPQNANRLQPIPISSTNGLLSGSSDHGFFTESSPYAQNSGAGAGKAGKAGKAGEAGNKAAVATKETVVAMPDAESSIGTDTGASSIPVLTAPTGSIAKTNGSDSNQGAAHEDSQQSRVVTVQDFGLGVLEHLEAENGVAPSSFRQRLYLWAQKLAALGGMTALSTNERYAALRFLLTPHRDTEQRSTVFTSATPAPVPTKEERWRWDLQVVRFTASPLSVSTMPKPVAELKTGQLFQDLAVTAKPSLMKANEQSSWSIPFGSVGTAAPVADSADSADITQGRHDQSNTWVQVRCALSLLPQDPLSLLEVYQQLISLNPYWQQWGLDLFFTWRCEPESDFGSDHYVTEKAETPTNPTNISSSDRTRVNGLKGLSLAEQGSQHQRQCQHQDPEFLSAQAYSTAVYYAEDALVAAQGAQNPLGDKADTALQRSTSTGDSSWIQDNSQLCGELVLLLLPRRSFSYSYPDPPPAPIKLLQLWEGVGSAAHGNSAALGANGSSKDYNAGGIADSSQTLENSSEHGSHGASSYSSAAHPRGEHHEVSSSNSCNSSAVLKQAQGQGCPHVGTDPIQGSALLEQGGLKLWQWYQQNISGKSKRRLSSYENLVRWGPQFDAVVYAPRIAELWQQHAAREARGRSSETAIPDSYAQNLVRTQLCLTLGLGFVRYALASVQVCLDESDFRTQTRGLYGIQYYAPPEPNKAQSMRMSATAPVASVSSEASVASAADRGTSKGAQCTEIYASAAVSALKKLCPQLPWQPCSQLKHLSLQQPLCLSLGQLQALMVDSSLQQDYSLKRWRERTYIYSYRERLSKRPLSAYDGNFPLRTDVFLGCTNCRVLVEEYYQARIRRLHHARPLTLEMEALEGLGVTAGFVYCQVLPLPPLPSLPPLPRAGAGAGRAQSSVETAELNNIESKDLAPCLELERSLEQQRTLSSPRSEHNLASVDTELSAVHLNMAHLDGQNLSLAVPDFSLDVLQRLQQLKQALRAELALIDSEQAQAQAKSTSKSSTADIDADTVLPVAQLIGYAIGTSYLYLDFVLYDRMSLEQALKRLNDSGKLQALGLGRLHYHSFYREGTL